MATRNSSTLWSTTGLTPIQIEGLHLRYWKLEENTSMVSTATAANVKRIAKWIVLTAISIA